MVAEIDIGNSVKCFRSWRIDPTLIRANQFGLLIRDTQRHHNQTVRLELSDGRCDLPCSLFVTIRTISCGEARRHSEEFSMRVKIPTSPSVLWFTKLLRNPVVRIICAIFTVGLAFLIAQLSFNGLRT